MGLFNFSRDAGQALRNALGGGDPDEKDLAQTLQKHGITLQNLNLQAKGGTVTVSGVADSRAEREKAILILGNVKGVDKVQEAIQVAAPRQAAPSAFSPGPTAVPLTTTAAPGAAHAAAPPQDESRFYTVKPGDSLSKIAQQFYGSPGKYQAIFEANRPMLSDPDEIYPGQVLRVPVSH